MTDILAEICAKKREHIAANKQRLPESELRARLKDADAPRDFYGALAQLVANKQTALIAEIKKASPSRGIIRVDFEPVAIAQAYNTAGAACLSVLTDTPYFKGEDSYLQKVRQHVALPLLRKDFMLDPYQIVESRLLGADCILLIMAALTDDMAKRLEAETAQTGMIVLVEVHDEQEIERALRHLQSPLIGVNNRNLKTLTVDLSVTERLRPMLPADKLLVCESGIHSPADIQRMRAQDVYCFLVGESLMRETDIEAATRRLLSRQGEQNE